MGGQDLDPPRNLSKGVFVGMASLLREPEGARPESCERAGKAVAGAVAEASVGVNPTAPRICSGVPDCSSGLWVPGSSGLRVWTCPPALLEAYQRLAS